MPRTLSGMPAAAADIFVCSSIGEPVPAPRATPRSLGWRRDDVTPGVWLVLAMCPGCDSRTGRYCRAHDITQRR